MKFTEDQIESFNAYQKSGTFHPFTCGSGNRTDKNHLDGDGLLICTPDGFECPYCDYKQDWAFTWMLDWTWKNHAMLNVVR